MRNLIKPSFLTASILGTLICVTDVDASTLNVQYFTASGNDFGTGGLQWGTFYNEVQSTLGADGLPVLNPAYSGYINDVNASGEILWWSPALSLPGTTIKYTGSGSVSLPYSNNALYPPNATGPNDSNGMQTAVFSGSMSLPASEKVTFTFGADDDAFLYVDGTLVSSLGGIHGLSPAPVTTTTLSAGNHTLKLFYADQMTTGAGLYFSVDTQGVTTAVPEPDAWALMVSGLGLLGFVATRRSKGSTSCS